jgi:hypothetical protein
VRIYVAGPYTQGGDMALNVRRAIEAADGLARRGHVPFIPHLTHFWHMLCPHEYEFWMQQDLAWLRQCEAVLRLEGESPGADREVQAARELGLAVYRSVYEVPRARGDGVSERA